MPILIRGLEDVRREVKELKLWARAPIIILDVEQLSQWKLGWLARDDRDFLDPSGRMLPEMIEAARKGLRAALRKKDRTEEDMLEPWRRMAEAARDRIAKRLLGGGNDLRGQMRALKPETIERKGTGVIGYDTGALYRDVKSARVIVRASQKAEQKLLTALQKTNTNAFFGSVVRPVQGGLQTGQLFSRIANTPRADPITLAEVRGFRRGLVAAARGGAMAGLRGQ